MHIRCVHIAIVAAGVALVGCGGSTAPTVTASFRQAAHLDTLAVNAAAAGQFDRYRLLTYPIAALAENVTPATVSVTVDGAAQNYQGLALELVGQSAGANPAPGDSTFVLVTWTGTNVDELVYTQLVLPDTLADVADLTDTVSNPNFQKATVLSATVGTFKGKCRTYSLPLANAAASDLLQGVKCSTGTITGAFNVTFTPGPGNPHGTFALASTALPAVRLLLPPTNGGQARVRGLLRHGAGRRE